MQIRIANIKYKTGHNSQGDWKQTTIVGEGDKPIEASTFEPNVLKIGDIIECEIEIKGKYSNLKSFQIMGTSQQPATPATSTRTQPQPVNQPNPRRTTTPPQSAAISGAEKGMIIGKSIDCFCAGLFTIGTQPELWEYIKSEISRVTGARVN